MPCCAPLNSEKGLLPIVRRLFCNDRAHSVWVTENTKAHKKNQENPLRCLCFSWICPEVMSQRETEANRRGSG